MVRNYDDRMDSNPYRAPSSRLERGEVSLPNQGRPSRRRYLLYLSTTGIWAIAVALHAWWHIWSILAGPPISDTYANNAVFQAFAFGMVRLPLWILALVTILVIEASLVRRSRSIEHGSTDLT
jgi:hypothetical protein